MESELSKLFGELTAMVSEATPDVRKADSGQKAAATRVRQSMQAVKRKAQEIRLALAPSKKGGAPPDAVDGGD